MDKSVSAWNTAVAFYPKVFRGVIYIFAWKAAAKVYRQVVEIILIGYFIGSTGVI